MKKKVLITHHVLIYADHQETIAVNHIIFEKQFRALIRLMRIKYKCNDAHFNYTENLG